jgi:hypothetical protein
MKYGICVLAFFCYVGMVATAAAQTKMPPPPDESRGIVATEFLKARPSKAGAAAKRSTYRRVSKTANALPAASGEFAQLGLTIWRLRPAKANDEVRTIVQEGEDAMEWTPERVESDTAMRAGDRIRFSFEAPQAGHLYVITREQYADGSLGEAALIFPTTRTRGGDNRVAAGHIVEIPAQDDRPNFFTLRRSRADHLGENLIVIVTPQPLPDLTIGVKALALSNEQITKWEQTWGARVERFELTGGAGKTWTRAEQQAGADATRQLTQDDPGPQTIYRVAVKPEQPMLINIGLRYGQANNRGRARR